MAVVTFLLVPAITDLVSIDCARVLWLPSHDRISVVIVVIVGLSGARRAHVFLPVCLAVHPTHTRARWWCVLMFSFLRTMLLTFILFRPFFVGQSFDWTARCGIFNIFTSMCGPCAPRWQRCGTFCVSSVLCVACFSFSMRTIGRSCVLCAVCASAGSGPGWAASRPSFVLFGCAFACGLP